MLGWCHAVPEGEKTSRGASDAWPLPDCEPFGYIAEWFVELRYSFSYAEVRAWSELYGQALEAWELDVLVSAKNTYENGLVRYRGKEFNLRPPYDGRTAAQRAEMIDRQLGFLG